MRRAKCQCCWRVRPLKHLRRTDPMSDEVQWGICCRSESRCGNARDTEVARWTRRDLGRNSNEDGCLFSIMKYATPHKRSGRRAICDSGFR